MLKPQLIIRNVDEEKLRTRAAVADSETDELVLCSRLEEELALLPAQEDRAELLALYNLNEPCLSRFLSASRKLLRQQVFFTKGRPGEAIPAHMWPYLSLSSFRLVIL